MKKKSHQGGFRVPEGYFNNLSARLEEKMGAAPAKWPESDGFKAPEGYFDTLGERLIQKSQDEKIIRIRPFLKYWPAAAALVVILSLAILLPSPEASKPSFEDLAGADIAQYMERSMMEFTDDEIVQLFPLDDLEMSDMLDQQLTEEHIMEYLDASVEDYDELNMEFDE